MAITLHIEKIVHGGMGLARHEGAVVFVDGVIPGEIVQADITCVKAKCLFADLLAISAPSADRREPFCAHAGVCGGCNWQHIRYERQCTLKREIVLDCLSRIGKIGILPACDVFSDCEQHYRLRAQFKIDSDSGDVGFYERNSNTVRAIDSCPLLVQPLNRFLYALSRDTGRLERGCTQIKALAGTDGRVASWPVVCDGCVDETKIVVDGNEYSARGDSFFQSNAFLLSSMNRWAADDVGGGTCLDLYGGLGFFSLALGKRFGQGICVEHDRTLVALANRNFERNGLSHFRARVSTVEVFLAAGWLDAGSVDCVVVDPPRSGLTRPVREGIGRLAPATIVCVSCDPATAARDIGYFVGNCGYRIARAAVFDCYPNTHHVETMIVLKRYN